ncbi:uncharacterized protein LOC108872587 isoform X3, partial [Lates japonicus]
GSGEYICDSDNQTYVSLIISNVMKEENYTAAVITDCGLPLSSPINVQVKHFHGDKIESELNLERDTKISAILCICVVVIVAGILYFLLGTDRGRKIIKHFTREKIQRDNSDTDSESSKNLEIDF